MLAKRKPGNSRSQYHSSYSPLLIAESYHATRMGEMPVALGIFGEKRLIRSSAKSRSIQTRVLEGVMLSFEHLLFEAELQRR